MAVVALPKRGRLATLPGVPAIKQGLRWSRRYPLLPGAVLVFSGIALTSVAGDAPWLEQAVERYPLVIFAGGLLLAWRFRRSRVGAALLGLILLDRLLRPTGASVVGLAWAGGR